MVDWYHKKNPIQEEFIKIKLSLDGTIMSRTVHIINFVFGILNEKIKSITAKGNYTLGIFHIKSENYSSIYNWLTCILNEIKTLQTFSLGVEIPVKYYFCSDWKAMAIVLGIKAANSNYPCLYCEVSSDKLHLVLAEKDIAYRPYEHKDLILKNENFGKKSFIDYGYSKKPMLSDIPHHRFIICELHLFLRVSDVLFDLLIRDVEALDKKLINEVYNVKKHHNLKIMFDFLEKIKVNITPSNNDADISENKNSGVSKLFCSLMGDSRHKIFQNINIHNLFDKRLKNSDRIQLLWENFYKTYNYCKSENVESALVKTKTKEWLTDFLKIYHKKHVTPYMHVLVNHVHQIFERNDNLHFFSGQGLEKLNDLSTQEYFCSTNKHEDFMEQMLLRRCRMDKFDTLK